MKTEIVLENDVVKLMPLKKEHNKVLWGVAQQVDLYRYGSTDVSTINKLNTYINSALDEVREKKSIPFAIYAKKSSECVGCTRYGNIDLKNKVLHIGWTWISSNIQGTGFNHQMKFLMLSYAFETLGVEKVEFRIDERNIRSRKAVEKLGAALEGILRKNVVTKDGYRRNSCCYGILKEEWLVIKTTKFTGCTQVKMLPYFKKL